MTSTVTPGQDFAAYLTTYVEEMAFGAEDPGTLLDRYHTPEIEWYNDGIRLDRARLLAHARPVRKTVVSVHVETQDIVRADDRIAARYTLHATTRQGKAIITEIYTFGQLATDGRLRRVDQITRTISDQSVDR